MTQPPPTTRAELRTALQVQTTTAPAPVVQPRGWRGRAPRAWRVGAPLLALLVWWPAGFSGLDNWFFLPLRARDGDLPICTLGGLKGRGHPVGASGAYQIVEVAQ